MTGSWLAAAAARFLRDETHRMIVAPAIADLQIEEADGHLARARGYLAVWRVLAVGLLIDMRADIGLPWTWGAVRNAWVPALFAGVCVACASIWVPPGAFANLEVLGWDGYAIVMTLAIVEKFLTLLPVTALQFASGLRQITPRAFWPALVASAVIALVTVGANVLVIPALMLERHLYATSATERFTESPAGNRGRQLPLTDRPLWERVARLKERAVPDPPAMPRSPFGTPGVAVPWGLSAFAFAAAGLWVGKRTRPRPTRRDFLNRHSATTREKGRLKGGPTT
jgi:hypothetical protein